jgi:hypothetical protein
LWTFASGSAFAVFGAALWLFIDVERRPHHGKAPQ